MTTTTDDTFVRLRPIAAETLAVDEGRIELDASFADDLEADSLDLVELVMALEEEFDVEVDESELDDVRTVRQAVELVASKRS